MGTVAIAGWGYNGGQVIFKKQPDDDLINPHIYKEVAENCKCCCLPPPRVTLSLHPGYCETSAPLQNDAYNNQLRPLVKSAMTFSCVDVPCPIRGRWEYFYEFTPEGGTGPAFAILYVPRCAQYSDFKLVIQSGYESEYRYGVTLEEITPSNIELPGCPAPVSTIRYFGFRGHDEYDDIGLPEHKLCIENVCKPNNIRTFRVPCYRYADGGGPSGMIDDGVPYIGGVTLFPFFCQDDGHPDLAYIDVEFPGDLP